MINKLLIFEGIDKTGKSTIRNLFLKKYPDYLTVDRFVISNLVYDRFYKRKNPATKFLLKLLKLLPKHAVIIYTFCDYKTYCDRCKLSDHEVLTRGEFNVQHSLFALNIEDSKIPCIALNTSDVSPEISLTGLIDSLFRYEKH